MDEIINKILNEINILYVLVVITLTYGINKVLPMIIKNKDTSKWIKRFTLVIICIIIGSIYIFVAKENIMVVFNSSILAPVIWSWIFKPIFNKIGIDYKHKTNQNEIN